MSTLPRASSGVFFFVLEFRWCFRQISPDETSDVVEVNAIETTFTFGFHAAPSQANCASEGAHSGQLEPLQETQSRALALDDGELVQRLAAGDGDALALIYDRHAGALYRLLLALLSSPSDAEDVLQEVFVKFAGGRLRIGHLRSYLLVAARHQALGVLRRRRRETQWDAAPEDETNRLAGYAPAADENGSEIYDWPQLLARLPVEQREVIALKVWEQMTFGEIAAVVKASPNTVASRYRYGIERLRAWCREEDCRE